MDKNSKLCFLILVATFSMAFSRAPPYQGRMQHPAVMTRTKTQPQGMRNGRNGNNNGNKQQKNTTTPEPPEVDDDLFGPNFSSGNSGQQGYFGFENFLANLFYDYGMFSGGDGAAGGTSWEYDDDIVPTQYPSQFGNRGSRTSYSAYTTPKPTTTTPEQPEHEEEKQSGSASAAFGTNSALGASGHCFCSPLNSCPSQSIPRGGLCVNFLSVFSNARFIRCCYSPSMAKRLL